MQVEPDHSYSRIWLLVAIMRIELLPVDRNTCCALDPADELRPSLEERFDDEEMTMIGELKVETKGLTQRASGTVHMPVKGGTCNYHHYVTS